MEKYLRKYVGDFYQIAETDDIIYMGTDLPDEYAWSNYTKHIKGTVAKAKAKIREMFRTLDDDVKEFLQKLFNAMCPKLIPFLNLEVCLF